MKREEAKEKMYQHLLSDYDLTRSEAKNSFEMQIIDEIYDDFDAFLEKIGMEKSVLQSEIVDKDNRISALCNPPYRGVYE